jgi:hypothetical protein
MAQYRRRPLVVVDHIGDLARTLGLHDMRVATARIVDQLKGLTEQGLTVLAVSQVARAVISDPNATRTGRSYEGAAKDAGEVEEGAATLLYLNTEPTEPNGTASAQLHIAKSRGAPGNEVVGLRFYGALGCFEPDTLAELPKAQKEVLQAIASLTATGGYASVDGLKVKLRWGQDKINPILRTLADRRLIKRDKRGISLTPSEVQS